MYRLCICYYSGHVKNIFGLAIAKHRANNITEYTIASGSDLTNEDKAHLSTIERYNLNQDNILNAWRMNPTKGREELRSTSLELSMIEKSIEANSNILESAMKHGVSIDKRNLAVSMFGTSKSAEQSCIDHVFLGFSEQKKELKDISRVTNILEKEDKFLSQVDSLPPEGGSSSLRLEAD